MNDPTGGKADPSISIHLRGGAIAAEVAGKEIICKHTTQSIPANCFAAWLSLASTMLTIYRTVCPYFRAPSGDAVEGDYFMSLVPIFDPFRMRPHSVVC
ncbi:alpha/beta hydrolase [Anopheles sinensis]|uniref:Alpha/beta hydrolase n=1 Tax=Anopheles sinensis TaxID=74873 RepID=A0A084W6S6_ANOSI|nr:alpha/beta hydrolase [Anopheles sinensis]